MKDYANRSAPQKPKRRLIGPIIMIVSLVAIGILITCLLKMKPKQHTVVQPITPQVQNQASASPATPKKNSQNQSVKYKFYSLLSKTNSNNSEP